MKSSNTTNDLIHFKSKKQELEKLHKREDYLKEKMHSNKASDNSHKVLQYPNKRKKTVKKFITLIEYFKSKLGKVGKFLKIIIYFLIFIILFLTIDKFLLSKNQKLYLLAVQQILFQKVHLFQYLKNQPTLK